METDRSQLLYGIKTGNVVPEKGRNVIKNGKIVGTITSGTYSPTLGCGIGFVKFKFKDQWKSQSLRVAATENNLLEAEVVDLPFFDEAQKFPKGVCFY